LQQIHPNIIRLITYQEQENNQFCGEMLKITQIWEHY